MMSEVEATNITTVYARDIDSTFAVIAKAKAQYFTALNKEITEITSEMETLKAEYEALLSCPPHVDLFSQTHYADLVEQ